MAYAYNWVRTVHHVPYVAVIFELLCCSAKTRRDPRVRVSFNHIKSTGKHYRASRSYSIELIGMAAAWKGAAESPHSPSPELSIDCRPERRRRRTTADDALDLETSRAPTWPHEELEASPRLLPRPLPCSCRRWRVPYLRLLDQNTLTTLEL